MSGLPPELGQNDVEVCRTATIPPPAVSVVIPAYNRAGTIRAALHSVLAQTWEDVEVIVVDDGSSDETVEAILASADPRLTVLRHRGNRGPSGARNTGICAARAPIVAFQDSDDLWLPDKLALQMPAFDDAAVVASYCGMLVTGSLVPGGPEDVRIVPEGRYPSGDIAADLARKSFISTQTLVARRTALVEAGLFDTAFRALEDWELALRLAPMGQIVAVPQALVVQRFSGNSLTRQHLSWAFAHEAILLKHADFWAGHRQACALQWQIVAGRMHAAGQPGRARAAIARGLRANRTNWRLHAQLLRSLLRWKTPPPPEDGDGAAPSGPGVARGAGTPGPAGAGTEGSTS